MSFLLSCSQGSEESANAKKITLTVSKGALVLPNELKNGETCMDNVSGPRVRFNAAIKWAETQTGLKLVPLIIQIYIKDPRFAAEYTGTISPSDEGSESLAGIFSLTTDYIPVDTSKTYVTTNCKLDFGGLPKPTNKLTGGNKLDVKATITMSALIRDSLGNDTPVVKEIDTTITYLAGSVESK